MNTRILNRAGKLPDDGFYQIEALGEHVNHAARVVQVIDQKAVVTIANRFTSEAQAAGENFAGQRVDKDHLSQSMENPTEAMGWNKAVVNRADGLYAQLRWTPLGRPLIKPDNPEDEPAYKFFSTEYKPEECEKIGTRKIGNRTYDLVRPLRLDGLSLTNDPNNKGQRPISNRNGTNADAGNHENEPTMKEANKALGLAEDAPETSTVAEIQKIKNRASSAESELTALKGEHTKLLEDQVETDLEKYKNRIDPKQREKFKKALISNRAGTIELLDALSEPMIVAARIANRATATPPGDGTAAGANDEEATARKISNRANELKGQAPARRFDDCWAQALEETTAAAKK